MYSWQPMEKRVDFASIMLCTTSCFCVLFVCLVKLHHMVEFVIGKKSLVFKVKRSKGQQICQISKILNFHLLTINLNRIFISAYCIQPPIIFEVNIGQKVQHWPKVNNLGEISEILIFHPIDLKFEEDIYFRSLNSTSQSFLKSTWTKRST